MRGACSEECGSVAQKFFAKLQPAYLISAEQLFRLASPFSSELSGRSLPFRWSRSKCVEDQPVRRLRVIRPIYGAKPSSSGRVGALMAAVRPHNQSRFAAVIALAPIGFNLYSMLIC
jgi:hypothetical protein